MSDLNVYTTSQINALTPITGDLVVDSDLNAVKLYNGSAWKTFTTDGVSTPYQNRWGASFDGSNDYLTLTSAPSSDFNFGTGDFGLSMWVKADSISSTYHTVLGSYDGSGSNWQVFIGSAGLNVWNGALYGGGTINAGVWYSCVVTRYSGVLKTYINGQQTSSQTVTTSYTPSTSSNTRIGAPSGGGWPHWDGLIDEVAIFNSGLSASNVTAIYNGTAPNGKPNDLTEAASYDTDLTANLKGYWRMGDVSNDSATAGGSIATITDSSGNGNDATQSTASRQPTFSDLTGETIYS